MCWQKGAITMASEKILNFLGKLEHELFENKLKQVDLLEKAFYPLYIC
jgi:hypothetical protein